MSPHHETVREILQKSSLIPFRHSPSPSDSLPTAVEPPSPNTLAGTKRNQPDTNTHAVELNTQTTKRQRGLSQGIEHRPNNTEHGDTLLRGRSLSQAQSPSLLPRHRSNSPVVSSLEAAATMLSRSEETGGSRITKLARGHPQSPGGGMGVNIGPRSSPRPSSRHTNESISTPRQPSHKHVVRNGSPANEVLDVVGITEFLQHDDRPVFVVDLETSYNDTCNIVFSNQALRLRPTLFGNVQGRSEDTALLLDLGTPFVDFKTWILSNHESQGISSSFPFCGVMWKATTIRKRLRVITGYNDQLQPPGDNAVSSARPNLQKYQGLGSSGSQTATTVRRKSPDQPSYFDVRPYKSKSVTPGNMESLVTSSVSEESIHSGIDGLSVPASASAGDSAMHDLLKPQPTPVLEMRQNLIPTRNDPESLHPMSMEYLTDKGFFDWTRLPMSPSLPDHIKFARNFDWAQTPLGPIEEWSADLRGMCNLIMASPHPAAMYWGPEHVAIYNEPYIMLAGQKHPQLMGSRYQDAWVEIWDVLVDVFEAAMTSAQATMKDDDCLFILRNGFLEETYFSWSIIPLIGDDGSVVGLYNPCFEKTRRKIAERRMLTLREIGERTGAARAISQFWSLLLEGFQYNEYDAPLVIVYSLNDGEESDAASSASSTAAALKQCRLEGTLGVSPGHQAAPELIDLKHDPIGFGAVMKQAITAEKPIVLSTEIGTLDESLLQGIQWRGFGDPSQVVVVAPIRPTTGESTLGFLIMGTNPRRPYDEDFDLFVQLLGRQLATSIASVVLFEEEIRKGERAAQIAAQDRIELSNQLAARTQEAVESENKFTRMAELAPVGMFIGDADGAISFANDAWYRIVQYPRGKSVGHHWIDQVYEADKQQVWDLWTTMIQKRCPITVEFRFKTPWQDKFGNKGPTWVLASASPEKDDDGKISRIFGSITDISSQKFAEAFQRKRMEEAVELKRQQERYIDTTSHEMRNPLSAILQSADSITSSLTELRAADDFPSQHSDTIDTVIESSQTITLCAQHQKRIVDDVLTLSKLDSAMLLVTPVDIQPAAVARRAVKMFEGELQNADIALDVRIDKSYGTLGVDWVRLDPTRLSQVLINLMTNAIKFTTTQDKRVIRMHLAASRERPSQEDKWKLTYIPSQASKDKDVTAAAEWGLGEPVYIHFAVQDTGRGLSDEEKKQLFQRFSQANPRTHVTYGGSGLGLFISRMLVELQGGEIGVASESGKGSTFAFYVKARRSTPPSTEDDDAHIDTQANRKGGNHLSKVGSNRTNNKGGHKPGPLDTSSFDTKTSDLTSPKTTTSKSAKSRLDAHGIRVLIVEDNLINQKVLATQLRKIGCIVSVANHGGEAIEQINLSTFHKSHVSDGVEINIVLMDLEMPVMDGMTCARTLRRMQDEGLLVRHIPVIAVTANAREEQIRNTLEAGIDDVVSKPFRIPELVPKMKDTIARFTPPEKEISQEEIFEGVFGVNGLSNERDRGGNTR